MHVPPVFYKLHLDNDGFWEGVTVLLAMLAIACASYFMSVAFERL